MKIAAASLFLLSLASLAHADALPRRGTLGLALSPAEGGNGFKVTEVLNPGAGAIHKDDIVLSFDGRPLTGPEGLGVAGAVYGVKGGANVKVALLRNGAAMTVSIPAMTAPPPTLDGRAVEMGVAQAPGGPRVRTYLLEPADKKLARNGRLPAVMILPGVNCGTVEAFGSATHPYTRLFKSLTAAGLTVVMADKPGQGDSEGTPCLRGGYNVEEAAFRAAAKDFVADKRIDPKRFYVIGISLGAIQAPMVAEASNAKAVITWGGLVLPWYNYLLTTFERRAVLQGEDPVATAAYGLHWRRVLAAIFIDGKTPAQIKAEMPEAYAAAAAAAGDGGSLETFAGRAWAFHREVDRAQAWRAWNVFDGKLLALHGEYDWVSELADHRLAVDIVNRRHPGNASLEIVTGDDHVHTKHATLADSFAHFGEGAQDDAFFTRCAEWLSQQAAAG